MEPGERGFVAANEVERARMRRLVESWSDAELARPVSAGWTVAAVLAHIGFWDARAIYLLDKWDRGDEPSEVDCEPEDLDWVNDAGKPLCLALPPRDAAVLALRLAEEVDARIAALSDEMLSKLAAVGSPLNLWRSAHRKVHLDEIRDVVGTSDIPSATAHVRSFDEETTAGG